MSEEHIQRRLTATFAADVAGFSRLMGEDEAGTFRSLRVVLDRLTKAIERTGGRVIIYAGDAVLADFGSVVDCVSTAVNALRDMAAENAEVRED